MERQEFARQPSGILYIKDHQPACPGGMALDDCETIGKLVEAAREYALDESKKQKFSLPGEVWRSPSFKAIVCSQCLRLCEVAVQTIDTEPQDLLRVSFYNTMSKNTQANPAS